MKPGQISFVSCGTRQGVYRPQIRIYYQNDRHGVLFETVEKKHRTRDRKVAVKLAKEWYQTPEGQAAVQEKIDRIKSNPENHLV